MCKTLSTNRTWGSKLLNLSLAVFLINLFVVTYWSSNALAQGPGVTPTDQPTGGCAIDGDLLARTPTTGLFSSSNGDFLENPSAPGTGGGVFTNPGGLPMDPTTAFHIIDGVNNGDQNIFTQGSAFNDNPGSWHWTTGSTPNKDDMNNALFHFAHDAEGHTWFMGGGDRSDVNGTSYLDFELLQNTLVKNSDGTFTSAGPDGGRTVGDIVVTVKYSNGGTNAHIIVYRWHQQSPGVFGYDSITPPPGTTFAASNINGPVSVPFGAFGSTTYQQFAYAECAFDINEIIPGLNDCIGAKTVLIKTKASDAYTAALKDFVEPVQLELGSIPTVLVNSPTICTGQQATLTANVTFGVGPFSYLWAPGGQTTPSITVSPTVTTKYSVTVTGLSGCQSIPDTGTVTVNQGPTCSITGANGPVCPSASNVYTAPAGMSSYAWSITGAGSIIGATNQQTVTVQASSSCNSSYDLMLTITNSFTCSSNCDKTVLVRDNTPPGLTGTWPANVTGVNNCMSNAPAGPSDATIVALYTDGCSAVTVTHTVAPTGTDCSWSFVYTYTIKDACNNVVTPAPTFTVSGGDLNPPALTGTWPSNVSGVNSCEANAPAGPSNAAIAALYTDACGGAITVTHTTTPSGTDCSWSILYVYTIKDKCNNTVNPAPTFTVSGGDQTAPALTGTWPSNITGVNNCEANAPAGPTDAAIAALYTDACGGTITVTHTSTPSGTDCSWSILYTYTIKDKCNNTVNPAPTFTVSGGDHTAPALTGSWPANVTGVNNCMANAPAGPTNAAIAALYTDACGGTITVNHTTTPSGTDCSWSVLYVYTIMDKCGNTVTPAPTFTVSGADLTAPVLTGTWPADVEYVNACKINAPAGPSDAAIAALYTDGCGGAITVTHTAVPSGTDCLWNVLYTYNIKDKCGNTVTPAPQFNISGGDLTPPVLTGSWPEDIYYVNDCKVNAPAGPSDADIAALYTDGCGGAITVTHTAVPSGTDCLWEVVYTYTIMDKCGHIVDPAPTFEISGGDLTPPNLTNLPPSVINGTCIGGQPTIQFPSATDNCDPNPQVQCTTGNCNGPFPVGSTVCTFQASDVCGKISNPYSVTVNVSGVTPCLIGDPTCGIPFNYMTGNTISVDPSIILANIASFSWTLTGPGGWLITAGATGPTVTYTAGTGTGTFTLTLVDIFGCTATCTKDITVQIADEYCTVTQGYWGNAGGNFCNTGNKVTYMNILLGNTGLLVGCAGNTLYFAPGEAQCIINLLPAGGNPARITGVNTCASHPGIQIKNGRINNVLLGQTITLGLNMRIKPNLALLALDSPILEVANSSGCLGAPPVDHPIACTVVNYTFNSSVYSLLLSMYGPNPTVANLFDLANKALGNCGGIANNMLSPINDAVTMINEKFDGCKWATFQGNGSGTNPISGIDPWITEDQPAQIKMSVMPNPFANSTVVEFSVSKSSHVTLELYNIMGSKIATLVDRNVNADETVTYPYTADAAIGSGMFICILRTEYGTKVTRMLVTH